MDTPPQSTPSRRRRIVVVAVVALVALVAGAYGWIAFGRSDAPAALDDSDLDAALGDTTSVPDDGTPTPPAPAGLDGEWIIVGDGTTVGYRIDEVLGGIEVEAAGRTAAVEGGITLTGTTVSVGSFTVDMATVTSDSSRRDGQFRTRIMTVDQYPTATFTFTEPIDIAEAGAVPADGVAITRTVTGELTLRGVTRTVTFEVSARLDGDRIGILGSIPIRFSDYEIPDPSNGFAIVKDAGLLEFLLVLERSGG